MMPIAVIFAMLVYLSIAYSAHAIIELPALILIPLAKLVAVIVSALSLPVASIGIFISKITKKHKLAIVFSVVSIILIAIISVVVLRLKNPNNPWF